MGFFPIYSWAPKIASPLASQPIYTGRGCSKESKPSFQWYAAGDQEDDGARRLTTDGSGEQDGDGEGGDETVTRSYLVEKG